MLDLDGGGTIEEEELMTGLRAVGKDVTSAECRDMMSIVDDDDSGEIDLAELVEFMVIVKQRQEEGGGGIATAVTVMKAARKLSKSIHKPSDASNKVHPGGEIDDDSIQAIGDIADECSTPEG